MPLLPRFSLRLLAAALAAAGLAPVAAQTPVARKAEGPAAQALRYREAKTRLDQGQYATALPALEALAQPAARFARAADAAYLAAVAAARQRQWPEAEQLLNLLRTEYPTYPNLPDALLLQGQALMEQGDYDSGCKTLLLLPTGTLTAERDGLLAGYLPRIRDRATWQRLLRRYPQNAAVGRAYAGFLVSPAANFGDDDRPTLETLVARFGLDRARYAPRPRAVAAPARKASYSVAVLLPFELDDPSWQKERKNQFVTDLYAGLRLAQDSLQRAGKPLQLFAYDTGGPTDSLRLKAVLALPELAGMDLLIGPVYKAGAKLLGRYAQEHQIVCVNPLSQDGDLVLDNPYHYLFLPSAATQGRTAAQYAADAYGRGRPGLLLYEDSKDEADFAHAYQATYEAVGGKIGAARRFNPDVDASLAAAFAGLDLAGAGHLVVASDARRVGPHTLGALRGASPRPPLLCPGSWVDNPKLDLSTFSGPGAVIYPRFVDQAGPAWKRLRQLYLPRQHLPPTPFVAQGLELLLFFGQALHSYGPAFQSGLAAAGPQMGFLMPGQSYPPGFRDNQVVPLTRQTGLDMKLIR